MSDINSVVLEGRLTRDPEAVALPSGAKLVKFSMASNRKTKDGDKTVFMDVSVFGKTADFVTEYIRKGRTVIVAGELYEDRWDDKATGQKRSKIGITANKVEARGGGERNEQAPSKVAAQSPIDDDSIPF